MKDINQESEIVLSITQSSLHAQMNFMLGKLKTLADVTLTDDVQRKALKDMLSQIVWERYNYMLEIWDGKGKIVHDGITPILP